MQTLSLMLVAVGLSLLIGIPLGIVAGRSDRFAKAITPVLDAMQIVPAFAYLMPVVILFSIGPAAAVVSTMIYAIPPAIRITALGIRGVAVNTVEAATSLGATRRQLLAQGPAPARAADDAARRQPDDPVRALDGRDRGPHRWRRARRSRHERSLLEPRSRDPRRLRDRDHGDRARPLDRGDRRRGPIPRSATSTTTRNGDCASSRSRSSPRSSARSRSRRRSAPTRSTPTRSAIPTRRDDRGVAAREDPGGARFRAGPHDLGVRVTERIGTSSSSSSCCRCRRSSSRLRGSRRSAG